MKLPWKQSDKKALPQEVTVVDAFKASCTKYNSTYWKIQKIIPVANAILETYKDRIYEISIDHKDQSIDIYIKYHTECPPIFCMCEQAGLTAILKNISSGFHDYGTPTFDKVVELKVK